MLLAHVGHSLTSSKHRREHELGSSSCLLIAELWASFGMMGCGWVEALERLDGAGGCLWVEWALALPGPSAARFAALSPGARWPLSSVRHSGERRAR